MRELENGQVFLPARTGECKGERLTMHRGHLLRAVNNFGKRAENIILRTIFRFTGSFFPRQQSSGDGE
jgi:hypothetical protein